MLSVVALVVWIPVFFTSFSYHRGEIARSERFIIPLAPVTLGLPPSGWLERPINFGFRCTLVDAAATLNFYGVSTPQAVLALELGSATDYQYTSGPPWWAYLTLPGKPPLLDRAIERVAADNGLRVWSQTTLGLNFDRAVASIARHQPVILNMAQTPDGTTNHSLLAYGYDTRDGDTELLVVDPNTQVSWWVSASTYWSETVTTTYITPVASTLTT